MSVLKTKSNSALTAKDARSFWRDFIKLYKSLPTLWDKRVEEYRHVRTKEGAYQQLLHKLQEVDATVTIDQVKKKINGLRTAYRREQRKVELSRRGGNPKRFYTSKLFYFNDMKFLDAALDPRYSKIYKNPMDAETTEQMPRSPTPPSAISLQSPSPSGNADASTSAPRGRKRIHLTSVPKHEICLENQDHISQSGFETVNVDTRSDDDCLDTERSLSERQNLSHSYQMQRFYSCANTGLPHKDEPEILSASWAALYRRLDVNQQLLASKTIMEVLYQGAMGRLHEFSYKAVEKSGQARGVRLDQRGASVSTRVVNAADAYIDTPVELKEDLSEYI